MVRPISQLPVYDLGEELMCACHCVQSQASPTNCLGLCNSIRRIEYIASDQVRAKLMHAYLSGYQVKTANILCLQIWCSEELL